VFEHTTEIIREGKSGKPNEFGKMVKLQEAENQIVIDFEVYDARPSDSDLLVPAIRRRSAVSHTCWRNPVALSARCSSESAMRPSGTSNLAISKLVIFAGSPMPDCEPYPDPHLSSPAAALQFLQRL
jgi:hypothetical protein